MQNANEIKQPVQFHRYSRQGDNAAYLQPTLKKVEHRKKHTITCFHCHGAFHFKQSRVLFTKTSMKTQNQKPSRVVKCSINGLAH